MPGTFAVADEWHELLVTYEGPFHPSIRSLASPSSPSTSNNNRKTFCITLPPSGTSLRRGSSYVSYQDLVQCVSEKIGWPPHLLCIKNRTSSSDDDDDDDFRGHLFPSHSLRADDAAIVHHQHPPLSIVVHPRHASLLGGKGGFGTLLKGQSKQAGARTTLDFGACRDLSGRRLRHVNDEIKLRKWRDLQARRERAAADGTGAGVDELAALETPSGIRNWHLMVPSWSEGAAFTNKGKRKIERQLRKEVRGWQAKEERARMAKEEKRLGEEWAVMEYVRRGEEEVKRHDGQDVKEGILAHLRKRKAEKMALEVGSKKENSSAAKSCDKKSSFSENVLEESASPSSHLITLSGEMAVFDLPKDKTTASSSTKPMRIQSQSDFATVVILLNAAKLEGLDKTKQGVYMEYTIQSAGLAQIGWIRSPVGAGGADNSSTAVFLPNSDTGDGVGDDSASFGYDGSRGIKFHDGNEAAYGYAEKGKEKVDNKSMEWKAGDVLGCWCKYADAGDDENNKSSAIEIGYTLNGLDFGTAFSVPTPTGNIFGYYPAVSLNLDEAVDVNVGPKFEYHVKDGCLGAFEFVGVGSDDICNAETDGNENILPKVDGACSKPEDIEGRTDKAPQRKKPRDESTSDVGNANEEKGQTTSERETFDLAKCSSLIELNEIGPDRLKNILLSMGVKCGGTTEERAKRLFSLKGLSREDYPNKVRGKNFIC